MGCRPTSGEYKQGKNKLREEDAFCCLGVLCDLYAKKTGIEWQGEFFLGQRMVLTAEVIEWAYLSSENPVVSTDMSLAELNDHKEKDFNELAEIIENEL